MGKTGLNQASAVRQITEQVYRSARRATKNERMPVNSKMTNRRVTTKQLHSTERVNTKKRNPESTTIEKIFTVF